MSSNSNLDINGFDKSNIWDRMDTNKCKTSSKPKVNPVYGYKTDEFIDLLLAAFDLRKMKPVCGYMIIDIETEQLDNNSISVTVEYGVGSHTNTTLGPNVLISYQLADTDVVRRPTVYDIQYLCVLPKFTIKRRSPTSVIMTTVLKYQTDQ